MFCYLLQLVSPIKETAIVVTLTIWPFLENSKKVINCMCSIHEIHEYTWMWDCCWPRIRKTGADPINSCHFSLSPTSHSVRWGSMMKPGWSSNRSTTPTCERVGNRRKSSLWVSVSTVRSLSWFSWCLRKQRGLYFATAGTGLNAGSYVNYEGSKSVTQTYRICCMSFTLENPHSQHVSWIIYCNMHSLQSPLWF